MYGFFILLCLPFVWQQILLSSQPVSAIEPKFVPKSGIEKQNLFGGIACLNEVRVSLGVNCTFKVTPNLVAEYNVADCPTDTFELIISDQNAKAIPNNLLTGEHAGQRLKYFLRRVGCDEAGCWGILVVEDKNGPRIDSAWFDPTPVICSKVDYILNNPQTIGKLGRTSSPLQIPAGTINYRSEVQDKVPNLGLVKFSNCDPDCPLSVKWSDKLEVYGCDSLSKNGLYARILRTWVATNCVGMRADTVQVIAGPGIAGIEPRTVEPEDRRTRLQGCRRDAGILGRIDRPLGDLRKELGIDARRLRRYYARERASLPETPASQRLPMPV